MLFDSANLPYWIFLGLGVLLFAVMMLTGSSDDDTDVDLHIRNELGLMLLGLLGVGQAPLLLLLALDLCLWGLFGWMYNVVAGIFLGQIPDRLFGWGGLGFFGSALASGMVGSAIAKPVSKFLIPSQEDADSDRLMGRVGVVRSAFIPRETIGQVDVVDGDRNRITIHATLPPWATVVPRWGESVIAIDRHPNGVYVVIAQDGRDRDRWLARSSRKR